MRYSSIMGRSLSRNRLMRLVAAGAVAVPALQVTGGAAQDATLSASPATSPASGDLAVRRNATSLSAAEKKAFTDAILAIKATPSPWNADYSIYDQFVVWHRDAFACDLMAAHMGPAFFPWHRMFLKLFEEQLQAIDPSVTVPYWDWAVDDAVDSYVWQDDLMGGLGRSRPSVGGDGRPLPQGQLGDHDLRRGR